MNEQLTTLENEKLSVSVRHLGAELTSLYRKADAQQLLWQGDSSVWSGQAPILFPVVGRLRKGGYEYREVFYPMGIHGFASQQHFEVLRSDTHSVVLRLIDNAQTHINFPFAFLLDVGFAVVGGGLAVSYRVLNTGGDDLCFSIGSHPAFSIPGWKLNSPPVSLLFRGNHCGSFHRLHNGLLGPAEPSPIQNGELIIDRHTFQHDALIFRDTDIESVELRIGNRRQLSVETGKNPHLGIWAKPGAPYLCIEPWLTTDDQHAAPIILSDKPGFVTLSPGQEHHSGYAISIS